MSLDYNYGKIKGFVKATDTETSRIEGYPNRKDEWGNDEWNGITNGLTWATMSVGINVITEKNWKEFYQRQWQLSRLSLNGFIYLDYVCCSSKKCENNSDGPIKTRPFTPKEVYDHIGLSTNANTFTKAQWNKQIQRLTERWTQNDISSLEKELQNV